MNVNEYIESGVVEMYVAGLLGPEERKEFEQRLLMYPELSRELNMVQSSLSNFAQAHSVNPAPALRQRVADKFNTGDSGTTDKHNRTGEKADHSLTYKYMIAASLAALVISTFASWFFYTRWEEAENRYTSILGDKNQLEQNYNLIKFDHQRILSDLLIMRDLNTTVYPLRHHEAGMTYKVRVYWNKDSGETYVDVIMLPDLHNEEQYQLWAISGDEYIDAGVMNLSADYGLTRMKDISSAGAWAITVESKGGSKTPNLNKVVMRSN
ncbi:MAG: hypothetical protein DWQ44_02090 [Bacteroidetes bacterium]|nr:MAG: hypothetical protein DWQ33_05820 [Bacteroidota bacterium]REK04765.1 MAG: hypothetical protein DWQ39_05985 [Bacteroidota bacterium]REK36239.1 MAG: hypothetical protein DWQ44_02090 [Bacteroidota bacterium]REK51099.1 MAG: hypothetical protein DWQ48_03135 [Bacteroidota bacterium]